ncbi:hypothetical protein BH09MYX1_BH09MYX1_29960 [soil metagenome]
MALTFSEQHAMSLIQAQLGPNERLVSRSRGVEKPWYSRLFSRLGSFMWKNYLVAATNQRILFIQHGGMLSGFAAKKVDALGWHEVERTDLGWGVFNKNLSVKAQNGAFTKTVVLGRFWMKDNFAGAETMVQTHQQARASLPPGQQAYALAR